MESASYWKKADQDAARPYSKDKILGEGDTIHNMCQIAYKKTTLQTGEFFLAELWVTLFETARDIKNASYNNIDTPTLRNFAARFCKTNPKEIFDKDIWKGTTPWSQGKTP